MSEGWQDKKWFGRYNAETGKPEEVRWRDLSFREKNSLLKYLVIAGYMLPTAAAGLISAAPQLYAHLQNKQKEEMLIAHAKENNEKIIFQKEHGKPVVYFKLKNQDSDSETGTLKKVVLPKNIIELMNDSAAQEERGSQPTLEGWEPAVTPVSPSVSESPVYRAEDSKKKHK